MRKFTNLILLLGIFLFSANLYAAPYPSYIYNFWGKPVPAPQAYVPKQVINGSTLEITPFNSPQDLMVTPANEIYIVDSGNNRLVVLDQNFEVINIIDSFTSEDKVDHFKNPAGVFVTDNGDILVADQDNERIVILNRHLELIATITKELQNTDNELFPASFQPQKVVADKVQRVYVLAYGIFDGIIVFNNDGMFRGFIGAPRVKPNPYEYFWYRLATDEQRQRLSLYLPVEHSNLAIDNHGFIWATVSGGALSESEKVRRLSPSGNDVLRRLGFFAPIGDLIENPDKKNPASTFLDVVPREDGIYSVLDRTRGRVFTYDDKGDLLYVFGGRGDRFGQFSNPHALDALGDNLIILDRGANRLIVFEPTPYALQIHEAIHLYNSGKLQQSADAWLEVLNSNSNYDLAYNGVGDALLGQGQYKEAMEVYRLGNNRKGYSDAFARYRQQVIADKFGLFVLSIGIVLALILFYQKWREQKRSIPGYSEIAYSQAAADIQQRPYPIQLVFQIISGLRYALYVIFHPFDGFWDLKHEKRGNTYAAGTILLLVTFTYVFMRQHSGFVVNTNDISQLNIITELVSILIPFGLWCIVNWALTTLMEGKGSLKDIFIASAYALTPIIIINIPNTILSNFLTLEESSFYYLFISLTIFWTAFLLFTGTMVTHEYEGIKTVFISILVIAGMVFVMFLGLLFFNLVDQVGIFFRDIYKELTLRV